MPRFPLPDSSGRRPADMSTLRTNNKNDDTVLGRAIWRSRVCPAVRSNG
jgi:hypothetical protein